MKRNIIYTIVIIILAASVAVWLLRSQKSATANSSDTAPNSIGSPSSFSAESSQQVVVVAPGRVEPVSEEIELGAEVPGRIKDMRVEEGDQVVRGQTLAVLENNDYAAQLRESIARSASAAAQLASAGARLEQSQAELRRVTNGARTEERQESGAAVEQAEAVVRNAHIELDRRRALAREGDIAQEELDRAERDLRVAEARSKELRERFAFVNAAAREEDVARATAVVHLSQAQIREAQAGVSEASAQIREAQARLDKTFVRSPITGIVLRKRLQVGESISPDDPGSSIFTVADTGVLRVRVDVDETDVGKVRVGQSAYVTADTYGERRFKGRVVRIGQVLGKKNIRTEEPTERVDTKILETLIELEQGERLPPGLRVDAFINTFATEVERDKRRFIMKTTRTRFSFALLALLILCFGLVAAEAAVAQNGEPPRLPLATASLPGASSGLSLTPVITSGHTGLPTQPTNPQPELQPAKGVTIAASTAAATATTAPTSSSRAAASTSLPLTISSSPLPVLETVGASISEGQPLSLREAVEMALTNNPNIEMANQNVRSAEYNLQGLRGVYDPRFGASSFYERRETPTTSFFTIGRDGADSVTESNVSGLVRLEGLAPRFGGNYKVEFSSGRATTDNLFASLSTLYPTTLTFNFTQPIIRGRSFDNNRRQIEIARRNLSLTDQQFRGQAINTIAKVQQAYWDLVFALRNLQVKQDTLKDTHQQLAHNRRQVASGVLAPIDVVSIEAQVARFEGELYTALDTVERGQNALKTLIAPDEKAPLWSRALVPTDDAHTSVPNITLPEAFALALANRPELQQVETAKSINDIDRRYFQEQTKPQVDLVANYDATGLAGSAVSNAAVDPFTASINDLQTRVNTISLSSGLAPLPPTPPQTTSALLIGGYGQSLTNLLRQRFNTVRVGVTISVPLRNRTAKADLGRSLVEGERIATQRRQVVQAIQADVRNALQAVHTAERRLSSVVATRTASEKEYASERRKFDAGRDGSSVFLVLERQTMLTAARGDEVRAQTDLNKAVAELDRAMGNTLQANNVTMR